MAMATREWGSWVGNAGRFDELLHKLCDRNARNDCPTLLMDANAVVLTELVRVEEN